MCIYIYIYICIIVSISVIVHADEAQRDVGHRDDHLLGWPSFPGKLRA